jgi:ELWxxDGT repeat protein
MQPPVVKDNSQIVAPVVTTVVKSGKWSHWLFLAPIYMVLILVGASLANLVSEYSSESNDSDSNSDSSKIDDQDIGSDFDFSEWQVNFASTSSDLPVCNSQILGRLYYVEVDNEFQVCKEAGWQIIDLTGPQGTDGNSPLFLQSQSTQCPNGGTRIDIGIDADGGGILTSEEIEMSLDICDGADGLDGQSGSAGEDGNNGSTGQDGNNGSDGSDGSNTAILTTTESVGANCAEGGIRIDAGIDDNGDGILQASEFDQTQFVCNGFNGSASPDTMLTRISAPPLSMGCTAMGRVVENGLDNGDGGGVVQNGVLEDGEVDYVATYCDRFVYERLTDINPSGDSVSIVTRGQIFIGSTMFFSADDGTNGRELWAYDFDNSSSWMIADINPGSLDSNPDDFTAMGTRLYFTASDLASGNELWAYETTNATAWLVFDISPSGHSNPESLTVLNSSIYFIAYTSTTGYHYLWEHNTTNGSTANLSDVSFLRPGWTSAISSYFSRIAVYDDYLYVTDVNGILHGYSPSNRTLWEVGPSGSPMTFDQAFSLQTVGDQIIIRTALTVDLTGRHSELWIYSPMNYSSWKLPITIIKSSNAADKLDPSYIDNSQIYVWGGSDCDCLYIYDSSNSTLWPVYMTDNGTQLSNQRQIGLIGSMMFHNVNGAQGPMYVHHFANSSTWVVGNFSGIWFMMEYDSSIIFTGIGDNSGSEYWRLSIERESTFY